MGHAEPVRRLDGARGARPPPAAGRRLHLLGLAKEVVRFRGDLDRMVDTTARETARLPTDTMVAQLRERAGLRLAPPVVGPAGPMTDTAIHLRDAARPLGLDTCPPVDHWRPVLDFLVSRPATRGFIPADRLGGLRFVATDQEWGAGEGLEVWGTSEALATVIAGRASVLPELEPSPGAELLARRVAS